MPTGSEILPCEPSGHVSGCQNVIQPSSTMKFMEFCSLHSKRFQLSYGAKVRAGAKKKGGRGRGRGEEETLAHQPHDSGKRSLIFHSLVHL